MRFRRPATRSAGRYARLALRLATFTLTLVGTHVIASAASPSNPHAGTVEVRLGDILLRVDAIRADVLRVRIARAGSLPPDESWVVPADVRAGRAAAQDASDGAQAVLRTAALTARVDRATLALHIEDGAGRTVLDDAANAPFSFDGDRFTIRKTIAPGEHFFALGDKTGPLDRRGGTFVNWTTDQLVTETSDPIYKAIPFTVGASSAGAWGLLLDNSWRSAFDFGHGAAGVLAVSADGGALDYYVVAGATVAEVVERYADLTGRPPLPPRWAFGYQQSRYSYMSAAEVRAVAARLRRDRFPADVIWLDIDFQDRDRPFTTDPENFAEFPGLVAELRSQGFHAVVITDLHVPDLPGEGYPPYDSGVATDAFIRAADGKRFVGEVWPGPALFPDFARADVRHWWGDLYAGFVAAGVAGFWDDMNEPSVFDTATKTVPVDAVQRIETPGFAPRTTTHAELHNLTGLLNSQATHEGLLRLRPDERPFVMTRSTFAGGQRWAVTWTGDNDATWAQLNLGIAQTLNLGLSGFAYTAVDVGGFLGTPDPDLLTRWFQVQSFMPLFRDHTAKGTPPQEPWVHGPEHEAIRRRYVEERYRLLPYIYALADEAARTGAPLVRPPFYDDPAMLVADCAAFPTFTLGRGLLVAPSPTPGSPAPYTVCLPAGRWFDYWTDAEVAPETKGAAHRFVTEVPRLDRLPVYVRAGTVLPRQAPVQSTSEIPDGPLELDIWPGPDCRGVLYDDDGHSLAYRNGAFVRQHVSCRAEGDDLEIRFGAREGQWQPPWRTLRITVHGWPVGTAHLRTGGATTEVLVDPVRRTACFEVGAPASETVFRLGG